MVSWKGDGTGCHSLANSVVWAALLHGLSQISPDLRPPAVTSSISPLVPVQVDSSAMEICEVPSVSDLTMQCGTAFIIFAEVEPGDLWAIAALFSQANALRCHTTDYPIKAIFGGGGYNADMSLEMLKQYLTELRQQQIVPSNTRSFDIDRDVYVGPSDPDRADFDPDWGQAFVASERNGPDPAAWPAQDALSTAMNSLSNVKRVLALHEKPTIIALREILELVIPWFEGIYRLEKTNGERINIQARPNYLQQIENRIASGEWNEAFFSEVLADFKKARVAAYLPLSGSPKKIHSFIHHLHAETSPVSWSDVNAAFDLFLVQAPQQFLSVNYALLTWGDEAEDRQATDLFTARWQPTVYQQLTGSRSRLARLLLDFTKETNEAYLGGKVRYIDLFFDIAAARGVGRARRDKRAFRTMKTRAKILSAEELEFTTDHEARVQDWGRDVESQQTSVLADYRLLGDDVNNFGIILALWKFAAVSQGSFVRPRKVLIPLLTAAGDNAVKRALGRVDFHIRDSKIQWEPAEPQSDSMVWLTTSHAGMQARRHVVLDDDIKKTYDTVFSRLRD